MKKIFSTILAAVALSSCVDTVILPENKTLDDDFWQKKSEVESVVATAYAQLRDGGTAVGSVSFQRNIIVWSDFRSDEMILANDFKNKPGIYENLQEIQGMQIQPNNSFTQWFPLYSCINYCNLVLEKGENVMTIDPDYTEGDWLANKAQVTALRALCYFYLVRVFRDVPVTPHAYLNSSEDMQLAQSAPADVLEMCINDLKAVVNDAPANNAYNDTRDRAYFNRDGINALLADIYLWRASVNHSAEDYQACIDCCDKVIAEKKRTHAFSRFDRDQLEADFYLSAPAEMYSAIFGMSGQNAEESIFELQYTANNVKNTALNQLYYGYSNEKSGYGYIKATATYGDYSAASSTPNVFKNLEDQRFWESCYNANEGLEQHGIRKFVATSGRGSDKTADKAPTNQNTAFNNWIVYRLTDVMLMKAEALVQIGKSEDAFQLVKVVNDRAINNNETYALKYSTYEDRMEQLVLMERGRELCFEGKRWFDLMRYNYRHVEGVDYTKKLSELGGSFVAISPEFYEIALNKYTSQAAMKAKMPSEPYLYMPLNEEELKVNSLLVQNPAYKSKSK